jgi:hypothetical protein
VGDDLVILRDQCVDRVMQVGERFAPILNSIRIPKFLESAAKSSAMVSNAPWFQNSSKWRRMIALLRVAVVSSAVVIVSTP